MRAAMCLSRRPFRCCALIGLCVFAAYGRVIGHEFLYWDDHLTLFQNPDLNPVTVAGVTKYWAGEKWDLYIPVTYTLWGALAKVSQMPGGLNPAVFHAASVLLHATSACLAFLILRLLCKADIAACAGALLFALHPVQVEPVAWASGMKDVLCGVLSLLAIWQYLLFAQSGRRSAYVIATIAYALAMLAKPSAVTVPLIAGVLHYFLVRREIKRMATMLALWLVMAIPIFFVTRDAQTAAGVYASPLWMRPLIALDAMSFYLRQVLIPMHLALDYGRAPQRVLPPRLGTTVWWVAVAGVGGVAWGWRRRAPWAVAAVAVFVAAVAPVLGFIRFAFQQYSTVADHYLYVAMLGPALALTFILRDRAKPAFAIAGMILLVLGIRSFAQAAHWRDSHALFTHTLAVNPESFAAHGVLGFLAREAHDDALAAHHYGRALDVYPDHGITNYNLANLLVDRGDLAGAVPHYRRAVDAEPGNARYRNDYAVALARLGRHDEAMVELETLLALSPGYPDAVRNLAIIRAQAPPASRPASQAAP